MDNDKLFKREGSGRENNPFDAGADPNHDLLLGSL